MVSRTALAFSLTVVAATVMGVSCSRTAPASAPAADAARPGQAQQVVQPSSPGQPSSVLPAGQAPSFAKDGHTESDTKFMQGMIHHHAQALEMVALLKTRTTRDDMKLLGQRIEVSQTDEIKMMRIWLSSRGEALPMDMSGDHAGMSMPMMPGMLTPDQMTALAAAKGPEFDRLFLTGMIQHHEGALVMVADLFKSPGAAKETNIFTFASDVDADQRMDISRMRGMLKEQKK